MLEIRNVSKQFGGINALADVSFTVHQGEIKAIIGPNGAGKSTLLNIVSGVYPPSSGDVTLDGERITGLPAMRIARAGVSRTFQHIDLFGSMTVLENIMVGRHSRTTSGFLATGLRFRRALKEEDDIRAEALRILKYIGLPHRQDEAASSLPIGEQRILEIGRALATKPRLLLLDEPASGLNDVETMQLAAFIRQLRDKAEITVVLVEHDMRLVMDISDSIVVLNFGGRIAEGTPKEIQSDRVVIDAYLGEDGD